ncbi:MULTISPECIES: hypothetical protein [unclassified Crossiella]|uniref:hypothetical protein n=1 Tax=unclassified Crossiella TaxID=2620835 RepID=UPI001FFFA391|nr:MULTISPECIES: hypothetical protein [unclassified Crossiella]MCK2240027.1 hypothetical protein [Crossiella sp. S99.2]MCK2252735.1 hypothetical protein [Crossiella sp. S99.1]
MLSESAAAVVAGLSALSTSGINRDGIVTTAEVWREIQAAVPVAWFHRWCRQHPADDADAAEFYDPDLCC